MGHAFQTFVASLGTMLKRTLKITLEQGSIGDFILTAMLFVEKSKCLKLILCVNIFTYTHHEKCHIVLIQLLSYKP